jgi:uncharacterized membrane protein
MYINVVRYFKNNIVFIALITAFLGGIIAIVVYRYQFCWQKECNLSISLEHWGQTGDFFGGILNPFFTFLNLIFIVVTITHSIDSSRKEQFESSFFNLLSLSNEIKEKLNSKEINELYHDLHEYYNNECELKDIKDYRNMFSKTFKEFDLIDTYYTLEQYYQNIYNIMLFIDNAECLKSDIEKKFYAKIIRSQLSIYETGLFFYGSLSCENGKFCQLANDLGVFDLLFNDYLLDDKNFTPEGLYKTLFR